MNEENLKNVENLSKRIEDKCDNLSKMRNELFELKNLEEFKLYRNKLVDILIDEESDLRLFINFFKYVCNQRIDLEEIILTLERKVQSSEIRYKLLESELSIIKSTNKKYFNQINYLSTLNVNKDYQIKKIQGQISKERKDSKQNNLSVIKNNFDKKGQEDLKESKESSDNAKIGKPRSSRIYEILLKIFSSEYLKIYLKNKFGENFHYNLINQRNLDIDYDNEYIDKIEKEISKYEMGLNIDTDLSKKLTHSQSNKSIRNKSHNNYFDPYISSSSLGKSIIPKHSNIDKKFQYNHYKERNNNINHNQYYYREQPWKSIGEFFKSKGKEYKIRQDEKITNNLIPVLI